MLTTVLAIRDGLTGAPTFAIGAQVAVWLWITVLFANFAEAVAEGRGKARADAFRATRATARAKVLLGVGDLYEFKDAELLEPGDVIIVEAGETIPTDGEVIEGIASVDESAITGESAPVIRESGGDRSAVTGGTRVVSDWIKVKVTARPGETFLDRMIALVEGAKRQKTPNEIALDILLAGLTLVFLFVVVTLPAFASWSGTSRAGDLSRCAVRDADPDHHRRAALGDRHRRHGPAGEGQRHRQVRPRGGGGRRRRRAADRQDRHHHLRQPHGGCLRAAARRRRARAGGGRASCLARRRHARRASRSSSWRRSGSASRAETTEALTFIPFTAHTRMSGADLPTAAWCARAPPTPCCGWPAATMPVELDAIIRRIAATGGTPLVVVRDQRLLGVVHLKDMVKPGIRERFAELRRMGIRTIMITGDNPLTAAAIAAEAGVDDFLAEATPESKLALIRSEQAEGKLVAMCGDGSNDAPALAQADIGVAMNSGTPAAKEAGNLIDLDSDPTKLIEVVLVGKQLLISRGALTTFSVANDVAKYFAILPALFVTAYPGWPCST